GAEDAAGSGRGDGRTLRQRRATGRDNHRAKQHRDGHATAPRCAAAHSVRPPSTMIVWPVIIAAPAHRKKIVSAMSCGRHARFSGVRPTDSALRSAGHSVFHGLSTKPGATALTRTSGASVRARLRVRLMTPALLVA